MAEQHKNSRRKFLDKGFKLGALTALGGLGISNFFQRINAKPYDLGADKIELMTTDGTIIEVDASEVIQEPIKPSNYNVREGYPNRKFVMVVDLAKCKNALKCQQACNKGHFITGNNAWLKVYKMQESKETAPYWMPTQCQHCDAPACVSVCPVDATFKRQDGIVLIDNERCIGCRFCMAACPYSTRVFNWSEPDQGEITLGQEYTPDYCGVPSVKGTVDKCDFCPHQIEKNELPFCVGACPNGVFYFGDKYEDTVTNGEEVVRFSELIKERSGFRILEGLGTEPNVYYLPPVDRLVDFEDGEQFYTEFESVQKPE